MCSGSYLPEMQDMPACLSEQLDALPVNMVKYINTCTDELEETKGLFMAGAWPGRAGRRQPPDNPAAVPAQGG